MNVLITGTTQGIGRAIATHFLQKGHTVWGIDRQEASISHERYTHYICDVRDYHNLRFRAFRYSSTTQERKTKTILTSI